MLEMSRGLTAEKLEAIGALEQRSIGTDGGRLKLEWSTLRARSADSVNDLLWWDGPALLGFVGLYCFDGQNVELVGMVDPATRRRGIATALLDAAISICRERMYTNVLLVTPRNPSAGRSFAVYRGGVLDHSEHALVLRSTPTEGAVGKLAERDIALRPATVDDAPVVTRLLAAAFGYASDDVADRILKEPEETLIIEFDGDAVGTLRVTRDGDDGGVYGFAVDPLFQGRGIGRDALRQVCAQMFSEGAAQVGLEVATENEHALGLYTSLGFVPVTTEDYFSIGV
jgi:ribosomal protein S18 acetylase RimI-like enzyme